MHEGGPSERWGAVSEAAVGANATLRWWEAVLSRNPDRAEHEVFGQPSPYDLVLEDLYSMESYEEALVSHVEALKEEDAKAKDREIESCKRDARQLGLTYREY